MSQYYKYLLTLLLFYLTTPVWSDSTQTTQYRNWIVEMKESTKGPFTSIRWYCKDGKVLPPKAYACLEYGGGYQHGKLSEKTLHLRKNGYWIANLLAGLETEKILEKDFFLDWFNQLLIEKFLIESDNGWILRKARYYRGAIQAEDERKGARQLLTTLVANPEWVGQRFPALRIATQLLPHGIETASAQKIRHLSTSLADEDKNFTKLRTKIHGSPDAGDAQLVRDYVTTMRNQKQRAAYLELAEEIDRVYQSPPLPELLERNAKIFTGGPWLQKLLRDAGQAYSLIDSAENHYAVSSRLLADLRNALPKIRNSTARLRILDLSLAVEAANFRAGSLLYAALATSSRQTRLVWLQNSAQAAYGCGNINKKSLEALQHSIVRLQHEQVSLKTYTGELNYLARVPGWSSQELRFQFYQSMQKLTEIEPLAKLFIQDMLRGSPLLFFSQTLDSLIRDANHLTGLNHMLFGEPQGVGIHALNPGLARGTLYADPDLKDLSKFDPNGIYLLPETISDLPPIKGIITAGEGNSLSHIQLLARNLGIPNVSVDEYIIQQLQAHTGETVVMAISPNGLVELSHDSRSWQEFFDTHTDQKNFIIRPDLEKLDLTVRELIDLSTLRASDSGRIVGPKAAKLGELHFHYPDRVAQGIAIPFGVFSKIVLEKPYNHSGLNVFEWMVDQYARIQAMPNDSEQRKQASDAFRAEVHTIIINTDLGDDFRNTLRTAMIKTFGNTDTGVFIRSDTNIEDLPGFTGSGLNLTLFNVVGLENIFKGINAVWASPFTPRAFAWRQSLMDKPEHVYPAILLMQTVSNDKSGVLITQDLDSGDKDILSVAVNEGVGGAVDGQSAESLRIDTLNGSIRLMATATAPFRKVPSPDGGIVKLPVSSSESVLKPDEINQLVNFAKELPDTFPAITDDTGLPAPADVEFGFYQGQLQLFQLRPFLQSSKAQFNAYLLDMDKSLQANLDDKVTMSEVPGQ